MQLGRGRRRQGRSVAKGTAQRYGGGSLPILAPSVITSRLWNPDTAPKRPQDRLASSSSELDIAAGDLLLLSPVPVLIHPSPFLSSSCSSFYSRSGGNLACSGINSLPARAIRSAPNPKSSALHPVPHLATRPPSVSVCIHNGQSNSQLIADPIAFMKLSVTSPKICLCVDLALRNQLLTGHHPGWGLDG